MARRKGRLLRQGADGESQPQSGDADRQLHGGIADAADRVVDHHLWALVYGLSHYRHVAAARPIETYSAWLGRIGLDLGPCDLPGGLDGSE